MKKFEPEHYYEVYGPCSIEIARYKNTKSVLEYRFTLYYHISVLFEIKTKSAATLLTYIAKAEQYNHVLSPGNVFDLHKIQNDAMIYAIRHEQQKQVKAYVLIVAGMHVGKAGFVDHMYAEGDIEIKDRRGNRYLVDARDCELDPLS